MPEWLKPICAYLGICGYKYKDGKIARRKKRVRIEVEESDDDIVEESFYMQTESDYHRKK